MKIKLKANSQGQFYFPKRIRDEWGHELEMTPNASAGAIYPEGTPPQEVIDSLEVVLADLRHRVKLQNKKG